MFSLLSYCLSALNLPFYIWLYDSGAGTLPSTFLLYQLILYWDLPIGGARGWLENWKEKGRGSFLFASCLLADYMRFSAARILHLVSSRSFSLRSRWFKYDIFPTLGKPASSHASSYRHLHQLTGAPSLDVWVPASQVLPSKFLSFNNSSRFSLLPQS